MQILNPPSELPTTPRHNASMLYQPQDTNSPTTKHNVPAMYQPRDINSLTTKHNVPAIYQPRDTNSLTTRHNVPTMYQPRETKSLTTKHNVHAMYQSRDTKSLTTKHDVPAFYLPRDPDPLTIKLVHALMVAGNSTTDTMEYARMVHKHPEMLLSNKYGSRNGGDGVERSDTMQHGASMRRSSQDKPPPVWTDTRQHGASTRRRSKDKQARTPPVRTDTRQHGASTRRSSKDKQARTPPVWTDTRQPGASTRRSSKDKQARLPPVLCLQTPHAEARLGNLMFMYASASSLARETGHRLAASRPLRHTLTDTFPKVTLDTMPGDSSIGTIVTAKYATYQKLDLPSEDVCIMGYLQSWRYFQGYFSQVREQFTFKQKVLEKVAATIRAVRLLAAEREGVRPRDINVVGMHVRRGDMLTPHSRQQGYRVPGAGYYYKAMLYFHARYPHAHFLLVSDKLTAGWSMTTFRGFQPRVVTFASKFRVKGHVTSATFDLALLSACDHVIGSVGSYSWWGAWLADGGDVVFYDSPVGEKSDLAYGFNATDFFMPHWKLMSD